MKKRIRIIITCFSCLLFLVGLLPPASAETIDQRIDKLEQLNKEYKVRLDQLEKGGDNQVGFTKSDRDTLDLLKAVQKRVQPFGSIGLRYHGFFYANPGVSRGISFAGKDTNFSRLDAQVRVGLKGEIASGLNYQVRLGMNNPGAPGSGWPNLSDFFNRKAIEVDRFYLDWRPSFYKPFHMIGGKFQNPIKQTQIIWDNDIGINGVFTDLDLAQTVKSDVIKRFAVGPLFYYLNALTSNGNDEVYVLGGALQSQFAVTKAVNFVFNLAYYDYHNVDGIAQGIGTGAVSGAQGGTNTSNLTPVGPVNIGGASANTLTAVGFASDFNLVNAYAEVNGKVGKTPYKAYVDQVLNVGAAGIAKDDNYGIYTGTKIGGTGEQFSPWVQYDYYWIEADANLDIYGEDEFGTNGTGHRVGGGITLAKNVNLFTTVNFFKEINTGYRGFGDTLGTQIPGISVPNDKNVWMIRPRIYLTVSF